MLPFSHEEFVGVFAAYNGAIQPAQVIAYIIGALAMLLLALRRDAAAGRIIAAILALMWLWTGLAYHGLFFARINVLAPAFAVLFVLQGALIAYYGVFRPRLRFGLAWTPPSARIAAGLGIVLLAYAPLIYPLIGAGLGQPYIEMPAFGVTPCPVTLFTFAFLLLTRRPVPGVLLVIPLLWSLIGGSAAFLLQVPQDWPLLFSGLIAVPLILIRDRQLHHFAGEMG